MSPAPVAASHAAARPSAPTARMSGRYIGVLVVLFGTALAMELTANITDSFREKQSLPLKRPLAYAKAERLGPRYQLHAIQPPAIDEETLSALGTTEYLQWRLIDTSKEPADPTYAASVFVTYYTGKPDMVPHVPDECVAAAGWSQVDARNYEETVPDHAGRDWEVPLRRLVFEPSSSQGMTARKQLKTVTYYFFANGRFVRERNDVRFAITNLTDRYAYYSKIEMAFSNETGAVLASPEEADQAVSELNARLIPLLLEDHFQDWDAIKAGAEPVVETDY